jgi:hypothetical protein
MGRILLQMYGDPSGCVWISETAEMMDEVFKWQTVAYTVA